MISRSKIFPTPFLCTTLDAASRCAPGSRQLSSLCVCVSPVKSVCSFSLRQDCQINLYILVWKGFPPVSDGRCRSVDAPVTSRDQRTALSRTAYGGSNADRQDGWWWIPPPQREDRLTVHPRISPICSVPARVPLCLFLSQRSSRLPNSRAGII